MEVQKIPVVFGIDKNYLLPAFVVMHSILQHSSSYFDFFLLSADEIQEDVDELEKMLKEKYNNFQVQIKRIDINLFTDSEIKNEHLSLAAYNRLLIPGLVKEYDKCIYLDSDVLVNGDLVELFQENVSDVFVAGVRDCHIMWAKNPKHKELLGIDRWSSYINSGVLVLNLALLRENAMEEKFLAAAAKETLYEDQDVINQCCYKKIAYLSLKYNLFHFYLGTKASVLMSAPYGVKELAFDWENPFILHMGGIYKPWTSLKLKGSRQWWQLAEIYHESEAYKCQRLNLEQPMKNIFDFSKVLERCRNAKKIVIWGYTENGRKQCDALLKNGIKNIIGFCDNNIELYKEQYQGLTVEGLDIEKAEDKNILWLVTCNNAYKQVVSQLIDFGVSAENIIETVFCFNKLPVYYQALDEKNYIEELQEIALCEGMEFEELKTILLNACDYEETYTYLFSRYRMQEWLCKCEDGRQMLIDKKW